jgi:hypothetical protein
MKLTFRNSQGEEREIGNPETESEAMQMMKEFCEERNFTIYYYNVRAIGNRRQYDVGSWSEFFFLEFPSEEEAKLA